MEAKVNTLEECSVARSWKNKVAKMKAGRGRIKGSSFERTIAKQLKAWWGEGSWARTPLSGGWAKGSAFSVRGDIVTTAKDFPFVVECKHYKKFPLMAAWVGKGPFWTWWKQALNQAEKLSPLLVFKANHVPILVATDNKNVIEILLYGNRKITHLYFPIEKPVVVFLWETFRKSLGREDFENDS